MHIFSGYEMPFYKFGDILFLQKINRADWVTFITGRFRATGKSISGTLSGTIADTMQNHPYYVQQYSQQVWLRTESECTKNILDEALKNKSKPFSSLPKALQMYIILSIVLQIIIFTFVTVKKKQKFIANRKISYIFATQK
jgi:hypothetical protein